MNNLPQHQIKNMAGERIIHKKDYLKDFLAKTITQFFFIALIENIKMLSFFHLVKEVIILCIA